MRIAYLIAWRGGRSTGPFRKMAEQSTAWRAAGHEVRLFVITADEHRDDWQSLGDVEVLSSGPGAVQALRLRWAQARSVRRWAPDVVYVRHGIWAPGLGRVFRELPCVIEVNGDEVKVLRTRSRARAWYAARTRGLILRRARGAVFVTRELAAAPAFSSYQLPSLVIGNGFDMSSVQPVPPSGGSSPRLIVLSHPRTPWHGVDKLVGLAEREPTWAFDVVGPEPADMGGAVPSNMTLHGWCEPQDYLPLVAAADIGFGALAMHRIGISEASALKVREYLAFGLPVVSGCADPDVPDGSDWFLELPNTPDNVTEGHDRIASFVTRWHGRRVPRELVVHMDAQHKEAARLAFLAELADAAVVRA